MSLHSDAIADILAGVRALKGEAVTYRRGSTNIEITDAVPLRGENAEDQTENFTLLHTDLHWGIDRDKLTISGTEFEPTAGDRITRTLKGVTLVYEVNAEPGLQPWDWSDTGQSQYRIKTKLLRKT